MKNWVQHRFKGRYVGMTHVRFLQHSPAESMPKASCLLFNQYSHPEDSHDTAFISPFSRRLCMEFPILKGEASMMMFR